MPSHYPPPTSPCPPFVRCLRNITTVMRIPRTNRAAAFAPSTGGFLARLVSDGITHRAASNRASLHRGVNNNIQKRGRERERERRGKYGIKLCSLCEISIGNKFRNSQDQALILIRTHAFEREFNESDKRCTGYARTGIRYFSVSPDKIPIPSKLTSASLHEGRKLFLSRYVSLAQRERERERERERRVNSVISA